MSKLKLKKSFNSLKLKKVKYFYSDKVYLCLNFLKFSNFFVKKKYLDFYNLKYFFLQKKNISKLHPNYLSIYFSNLNSFFYFLKDNPNFFEGISYGLVIYNLNLYNLNFFKEKFINHNCIDLNYFLLNFYKKKYFFFSLINKIKLFILKNFFFIKIRNLFFLKLLIFTSNCNKISNSK